MIIARGLVEGVVKPSSELLKVATACTTCGYCLYKCALQNVDVIIALRAELVRSGYIDPDHEKAISMILNYGNPYYPSLQKKIPLPRRRETIFFAGCSYPYYFPEKLNKIAEILSRVENVGWLGSEEPCCGNLILAAGSIDAFMEYGARLVKKLREMKVKRIVTSCPGCHEMLSVEYPKFFNFDIEVEHLTQLLAREVEKGSFSPRKMNSQVTFHDPCHLARFSRIIEEPRLIIENASGAVLVEMKHNRLNTMCCGGGGGAPIAHPRITARIADRRINEALETGASVLVTSCPLCEHMLSRSARRKKARLQIIDITELF